MGWVGLSRLEKCDGPVKLKNFYLGPRERRNHWSSLSTLRHQKEDDRTTHLPAALGAYRLHRSLVSRCPGGGVGGWGGGGGLRGSRGLPLWLSAVLIHPRPFWLKASHPSPPTYAVWHFRGYALVHLFRGGNPPHGYLQQPGTTAFTRCEWDSRPATHKCCLCPWASLPRRRRQCSAQSPSQGRGVRRVLATTNDAGHIPQGPGGSGSPITAGVIAAAPERLQSGHGGSESGWRRLLAVGNAVGAVGGGTNTDSGAAAWTHLLLGGCSLDAGHRVPALGREGGNALQGPPLGQAARQAAVERRPRTARRRLLRPAEAMEGRGTRPEDRDGRTAMGCTTSAATAAQKHNHSPARPLRTSPAVHCSHTPSQCQ